MSENDFHVPPFCAWLAIASRIKMTVLAMSTFINAFRFATLESGLDFFAALHQLFRPLSESPRERTAYQLTYCAALISSDSPRQACPAGWERSFRLSRSFAGLCCLRICSHRD